MIRRERTPAPPVLVSQRKRALDRLRSYHQGDTRQSRYPLDLKLVRHQAVVAALSTMFDEKCAYCESPAAKGLVEWHRPPQEAMGEDREVSRDHYWWLAYDWDNLYPICTACRSNKAQWFPVTAPRAEPEARGQQLLVEGPMLLDPCYDNPEHHFQYEEDGTVTGMGGRALQTIQILGLNRPKLLKDRSAAAQQIRRAMEPFGLPEGYTSISAALKALTADDQPFAGIRRWTLRTILLQRNASVATRRAYGLDDEVAYDLVRGRLPDEAAGPRPTVLVTPPPTSGGDELLANVKLERIEVRNFRAIREVVLEFRDPLPDNEPWLLLLGENGVGKSSLLKAVALALVDERERQLREPDAAAVVRHGAKTGEIRLAFTDGREIVLGFRRGRPGFTFEGDVPEVMVLGYGPTRLLPPAGTPMRSPRRVDVDNLFDPWSTLSDAEAWLADTKAVPAQLFNLHATDLKALLPMEPDDRLLRRSGRLHATSYGRSAPLADLSDGFRSVIALAADAIQHLATYWPSMSSAEGLLLIDELEVHLHPTWRMAIVSLLRTVFPRVRVIATTHDPLCLQQTEPGEVVLLRRTGNTGVEAVPRDVPKGLRADQLLTGDWFGMSTTTDRDTAELVDEHSRILLTRDPTPAQRRRRADLEEQLRARVGTFAETSVERLAQSVAAQVIRQEAVDLGQADELERARIAASVAAAVQRRRAREGGRR
ncbi:AAA family ATPase [Kribbella sp. NPDC050124]|uniref:AAA family ATPase n=1 Tax=Kribbella sp. NPDC050124 TaxID=3364114 RepID=UPI0037A3B383